MYFRACTTTHLYVDDEEERGVGARLDEGYPVSHPAVSADVVHPEQVVPAFLFSLVCRGSMRLVLIRLGFGVVSSGLALVWFRFGFGLVLVLVWVWFGFGLALGFWVASV